MEGFITLSDEGVGTLSWELPQSLQSTMDLLPSEAREVVQEDLRGILEQFVYLLMGAVHSGPVALMMFALINEGIADISAIGIKLIKASHEMGES